MQTVFSHIIQKRYSQSFEDIATDALAYILNTYETASLEMMRFLRGILPDLPDLHFRTQITEGHIRPDMRGYSGSDTFVYTENKFWAGLTEHQPISYLHELANYPNPTLLMIVVPGAREQMMISQLSQKITRAEISIDIPERKPKGVVWYGKTSIGPHLALTSWNRLLGILESTIVDDLAAQRDLSLLRSLCDAANIDRFLPINSEDITNQVTPALLKQMGQIIRDSVSKGKIEGLISTKRLNEGSTFDGFGRYIRLFTENGVGIWFGVDFNLWKEHGSPLWFKFPNDKFGRATEVETILRGRIASDHYFVMNNNRDIAISIQLETGVEKDEVIDKIMGQIRQIAEILFTLSATENE